MSHDCDVLIVGAGPGGCIAARELARAGLNVWLCDSSSRAELGKSITIELERNVWDELMAGPPLERELAYAASAVCVFSPRGRLCSVTAGAEQVYAVRLDSVVRRMLEQAEQAGARFFGGSRARRALVREGRVVGAEFDDQGREKTIAARLCIDASGFAAALLRSLDPELGVELPEHRLDVVSAENYVHAIDRAAAEQAVAQGLAADEQIWTRLGLAGNYSTEFAHLSLGRNQAYVLAGVNEAYNGPGPAEMIECYVQRVGFLRERRFGGRARIRVRRALPRLVCDGFAAIGEAACQVIPTLGSGVAGSMLSGLWLSRCAAAALKYGQASTAALWPYAWRHQSGRGAVLASYDMTRLLLERFSSAQLTAFMEDGGLQSEDQRHSVSVSMMTPSLASLPNRARCVAQHPDLLPLFARQAVNVLRAHRLYRAYPRSFDHVTFDEWCAAERQLFSPAEA